MVWGAHITFIDFTPCADLCAGYDGRIIYQKYILNVYIYDSCGCDVSVLWEIPDEALIHSDVIAHLFKEYNIPTFLAMMRWWHGNPLGITGPFLGESTGGWRESLQWRHNEHNGVSKHWCFNCSLNRLFRRRSNKTLKLRVAGPLWGEFAIWC